MEGENLKYKRYLLGDLSIPETEEIDLRVMTDELLADELSLAEADLIEDYLEGTLSPDQMHAFEESFLVSPRRMAEMREIALLKRYAARHRNSDRGVESEGGILSLWHRFLSARPAGATAAAVAVAILIGVGVWFAVKDDGLSALERDYARLNQLDLADVRTFNERSIISITPGVYRTTAAPPHQNLSQLSDSILFRLALASPVSDKSVFSVTVLRGGASVFKLDNIRVYQSGAGQEVRMLLPKSILGQGEHQLKLQAATGGYNETYVFTVD